MTMDDSHPRPWHTMTEDESLNALNASAEGLSDKEAAARLLKYGKNSLGESKPKSIFKMIFEQLSDIMVIILMVAMLYSLVMYFIDGEGLAEAIVIFAVITLNATVGVIQEKKAADAPESLKKMSSPNAVALREGEESVVPLIEVEITKLIMRLHQKRRLRASAR